MFHLVSAARAQETPAAEPSPAHGPAAAEAGHDTQEGVGHATESHGEGHGAFPPFDPATFAPQLLWLALTFGALYWLMAKVILPRIGTILEQRDDRVAGDLATAARLKGETDAAIAAYEKSHAEARSRAQGIAAAARDESKALTDAERRRLEADLGGQLEAAEARIATVKAEALANVDAIARDAAGALVETLLGAGAPPAEIAAAVDAAQAQRS